MLFPALHAEDTLKNPKSPPAKHLQANSVWIQKSARLLKLFRQDHEIKTYKVALGTHPVGPKTRQGDGKTPEGRYVIDRRNAASAYHRSLHISYPNAADRARAAALKVPPGGDVFIHGIQNGMGWLGSMHRQYDWTLGCVAVTDGEIEEIWKLVPDGTPVKIDP